MIRIKTKEEMIRDNLINQYNDRPKYWSKRMESLYGMFIDKSNYLIEGGHNRVNLCEPFHCFVLKDQCVFK